MTRRLLFVCGASTGGAFRSSLELADALALRGHTTEVIVEAADRTIRTRLAKRLLDAQVRLDRRWVTAIVDPMRRGMGARVREIKEPTRHQVALLPENAVPRLAARMRGDAVIVSSIRRPAWRQIRNWCRAQGVLSVLYMRGTSELEQLDHPDGEPDLLLSNTRSIADVARHAGHPVTFIPSLVDLSRSASDTSREVALLVSPTEMQGVDTALMLAAARPDVKFVLQQSWTLDRTATAQLSRRVARLPNVELRSRRSRPAAIYRDARVLLAPHRVDNRPRVILEAQSNGIPVLATSFPGLVDQMGDGGVAVDAAAGDDEWITAFSRLWDDEAAYLDISEAARRWASRPEQSADAIVGRFETIIEDALDRPMES